MKAQCQSVFQNWYSDRENSLVVDCSNYCYYGCCCFRLHIQKDNIPGKKERKKNKNQQNQQPLSPPKQYYICLYLGSSVQKTGTECTANPVPTERPLSPCSVATLLTCSRHKASGKCSICCLWTGPEHVYCVCLGLLPALKWDVWPGLRRTLSCTVLLGRVWG